VGTSRCQAPRRSSASWTVPSEITGREKRSLQVLPMSEDPHLPDNYLHMAIDAGPQIAGSARATCWPVAARAELATRWAMHPVSDQREVGSTGNRCLA
jgi:hypothetical protein